VAGHLGEGCRGEEEREKEREEREEREEEETEEEEEVWHRRRSAVCSM
jgi:hypothetical protein